MIVNHKPRDLCSFYMVVYLNSSCMIYGKQLHTLDGTSSLTNKVCTSTLHRRSDIFAIFLLDVLGNSKFLPATAMHLQ